MFCEYHWNFIRLDITHFSFPSCFLTKTTFDVILMSSIVFPKNHKTSFSKKSFTKSFTASVCFHCFSKCMFSTVVFAQKKLLYDFSYNRNIAWPKFYSCRMCYAIFLTCLITKYFYTWKNSCLIVSHTICEFFMERCFFFWT